ncbi:hypothetical protein B296_00023244 [Ensete ventricosum]|uniref:Uncharacterized protein n=1 Tax=Ensete ventricosum TaxID=4639 RepID=A0A426Z0T4_ENSVE|nr:hypothetical protein B296_00023244 [Ensete ventricosum]
MQRDIACSCCTLRLFKDSMDGSNSCSVIICHRTAINGTAELKAVESGTKKMGAGDAPVMMTVRWEASMPSVTCSAVEADPKPLGPGSPVTSRKSPMLLQEVTAEGGERRKRQEK